MILIFEIPVLVFWLLLIKKGPLRKDQKIIQIAFLVSLFFIVLLRVYKFQTGMGLDVDEAEAAYNSWSLGKYGVDDWLNSWPVYLTAWGSGMNILYPFLAIPFVKIFGLSLGIYRLPMLIISLSTAVFFCYVLLKTEKNKTLSLFILTVIFLSPVTIQYSRWAVESNLFAFLLITAISFLILFLYKHNQNKQHELIFWILFNIAIGLSTYAYSAMWIFLFLFILFTYVYIFKLFRDRWKLIFISITILFIITLPILLFIYVNYVSKKAIILGSLTITKLPASRSASQFIFSKGFSLTAILKNCLQVVKVLILGRDGLVKLALPRIGAFLPGMIFFSLVGVLLCFIKPKKEITVVFLLCFLASIPGTMITIPNYSHLQDLVVPVLFFEALGAYYIFKNTIIRYVFLVLFLIGSLIFMHSYFTTYAFDLHNNSSDSPSELGIAIKKADKLHRKVYLISPINQAGYTVTRFYVPISPYKFNEQKPRVTPQEFTLYDHYGKWFFNNSLSSQEVKYNNAYIVFNQSPKPRELDSFKHKQFSSYTLFWK